MEAEFRDLKVQGLIFGQLHGPLGSVRYVTTFCFRTPKDLFYPQ